MPKSRLTAVINAVIAAYQRGHAPLTFKRWRLPGEADFAQVQSQMVEVRHHWHAKGT